MLNPFTLLIVGLKSVSCCCIVSKYNGGWWFNIWKHSCKSVDSWTLFFCNDFYTCELTDSPFSSTMQSAASFGVSFVGSAELSSQLSEIGSNHISFADCRHNVCMCVISGSCKTEGFSFCISTTMMFWVVYFEELLFIFVQL